MKDKLGRNFMIGDYICFPVRQGSSMSVRIAKVIGLLYSKPIIISIRESWNTEAWRLCGQSVLECPQQAVILDKFSIPKSYTDLFNG